MAIADDWSPYWLNAFRLYDGAIFISKTRWYSSDVAYRARQLAADQGVAAVYCVKVTLKVPA